MVVDPTPRRADSDAALRLVLGTLLGKAENDPDTRRFARWVRKLAGLYTLLPPAFTGIAQLDARDGELHKLDSFRRDGGRWD